jgi:5-methylcytosine-specific restriction endonuclease McrA
MRILTSSVYVARNYWSFLSWSCSRLWLSRNLDRPFLVESNNTPHLWLRMRRRILRRDRYRCRGCDKKAEEVTLKIHAIRPDSLGVEDLLTLCLSCRALAGNLELRGVNIPDFLRHLWSHLHPRVEHQHAELKELRAGSHGP